MRYSSFSVFLNFLFVSIILVGSIVVYQVGNFDGISLKSLKKDYVYKKNLKFADLSPSEQKKYINKKEIKKESDNLINIDEINFDENSINSVDKLKLAIRNIKNKFLIVQNDNLVLFNEKQKLAKLLKKSKNELIKQKNKLTQRNLEQINETEQQHYKNISELTAKLNDLQRENIELSQGNNAKVIELKNKISSLNEKIKNTKVQSDKNVDLRVLNEKNKNQTLNETIKLLQKRVGLLQKNMQGANEHQQQLLLDKDSQISTLEIKNKQILKDKTLLIEKNTKTLLKVEQKQNRRLKEINGKIAKLQDENNEIKNKNNKEKEQINKLYDEKIVSLNKQIIALKSNIEELNKNANASEISLKLVKKDNKKLTMKTGELETTITELEKEKKFQKDKFSLKLEKNEKKHNENYKILNEQVFSYEKAIDKLKKDKNDFTNKENDRISQIRDAFNELRIDAKQRETNYSDKIKKLKYELKQRELFYAKKYKKIKPKKLVLISKVDCQDMPFGKAKATKACKLKVDKFLSHYDTSYYFEVVPIVDNEGFSSLKKLKKHKGMMPNSEIKRLTKLANLGLGKYRAEEGGRLVKLKFKDLAKISYAPNNIAIGKKRGFVIRVYK
ncbi:MAG: hypothetical protein GXP61_06120 [Epsilonproteobacteria bacterium]|nr:hypothetical protein [Campylobacterota bacterium]